MSQRPVSKPYGILWPNGEFTLSWRPEASEVVRDLDEQRWMDPMGGHGHPHCLLVSRLRNGVVVFWAALMAAVPLPCLWSEIHTFPETPSKYGSRGITRYGAKMVRSAAALLQRRYSRHYLTFATLTLPSMPREERKAVSGQWGRAVNRLLQYLQRQLAKQGVPPKIVGVSEIQGKRLSRTGEAYLHLHLVWPNRKRGRGQWAVDVDRLRAFWGRELRRCGWAGEGPQPRVETKTIEKSAEGYLGKYMSKGQGEVTNYTSDLGEDCLPGQWWFCTKQMRDEVRAATAKGFRTGRLLQNVVDAMFEGVYAEFPGYLAEVRIPLYNSGILRRVAWVGRVNPATREDLTGMLKCA